MTFAYDAGEMMSTNGEFTVRPMTRSDMDQVIEIERVSYPSPWQATHFLDELNSDFSFPLVVVNPEERVVAYICPHILLDEGHILNVAVHVSYRKRGIGRLLMQRVMDECQQRGV